jgi:hypothetical protein
MTTGGVNVEIPEKRLSWKMHRTRNRGVGKDGTKTYGKQREHRFVNVGFRTDAAANSFTLDNAFYRASMCERLQRRIVVGCCMLVMPGSNLLSLKDVRGLTVVKTPSFDRAKTSVEFRSFMGR